jgi:hypothetical protein
MEGFKERVMNGRRWKEKGRWGGREALLRTKIYRFTASRGRSALYFE